VRQRDMFVTSSCTGVRYHAVLLDGGVRMVPAEVEVNLSEGSMRRDEAVSRHPTTQTNYIHAEQYYT
jgi:hypothetical protein